jgi:tRNA threonylcarbamoyladenosine biosynthesis protein TsaB
MSNELILGIETSGILCSVAWWQNDNVLLEYNIERKNEHAVILADLVDKGYKELAIDPGQTRSIAIGSGPGSFTGLRIGMSYAKGFCFGYDIPLVPVTNFELLADHADGSIYPIYTLIEAGKGRYYVGIFESEKTQLTNKNVYSVSQLETIIKERRVVVVHEENSKGFFTQVFDKSAEIQNGPYSAAKICHLGYQKLKKGPVLNLNEIDPLYLQTFAGSY